MRKSEKPSMEIKTVGQTLLMNFSGTVYGKPSLHKMGLCREDAEIPRAEPTVNYPSDKVTSSST